MAHPPPPPGPPPEEDYFRLAVYHFQPIEIRNWDGGRDRLRQYIYRSAWYCTRVEVEWLQAEIKTFLVRVGMLGLFESFTHWRIQKMSDVEQEIARAQATADAQGGYQGAESVQPEPQGATDAGVQRLAVGPGWSSDSLSSDSE